jgi:hypothetical protein
LALEKVGDQVIKGLGKLRTQVEESLEDTRLDVGDLETMKDPRKAFQEKSKCLMKVEDDITLLYQWLSGSQSQCLFRNSPCLVASAILLTRNFSRSASASDGEAS